MSTTTKYVGIDVHQATLVMVVVLASGEMISKTVAATRRETVIEFLRGLTGRVEVAFEEGTQAQWLHDIIAPLVARVVVSNERGKAKGNKGDGPDALGLAHGLRLRRPSPGIGADASGKYQYARSTADGGLIDASS